jgi:hypothetical protein
VTHVTACAFLLTLIVAVCGWCVAVSAVCATVCGAAGGRCTPGVVPGHEFVGEVVELGPGSAELYGLEVGDQVTDTERPRSSGSLLAHIVSAVSVRFVLTLRLSLSSSLCAMRAGIVALASSTSVMRCACMAKAWMARWQSTCFTGAARSFTR